MWIWPVYRGPNVPNSGRFGALGATFVAPSGLFRQFLDGVLRSSQQVTTRGYYLPPTLPFDDYPHHVVLTPPSVAEAQVLHDGPVGVPYLVALVPIERQEA